MIDWPGMWLIAVTSQREFQGVRPVGLFGAKKPRDIEADLLRRVSRGDEDALSTFYEKYFQRLYRYIYYRVGRDHHHTEEVVHDTFMEALDKAGRYNATRGSLESWLITLSRNRIRSSNATMGRAHEREQSWSMLDGELDTIFASLDSGELPDAALEEQALKDLVGTTMCLIPEAYAKLLEMKYIAGMSVRDMAATMRKTEKAVESQLTRARVAFREAFRSVAVEMPTF